MPKAQILSVSKTLLFIAPFVLLASCSGGEVSQLPTDQVYAQEQLYQGYPCGDTCADFQIGYDNAQEYKIIKEDNCEGDNLAQVTGCKAYVSDYEFDHRGFPEMVEDFE